MSKKRIKASIFNLTWGFYFAGDIDQYCADMSNENGDLDTKDGGEEEGDEDLVRHRVCIMGFAGVGKSSLVQHFLESKDLNTFDLSLGKKDMFE